MLFAFSWSVDKSLRKALAPFCVNVRSLNFFRQTDEVFLKNILVSYAHGYSKQKVGLFCDNCCLDIFKVGIKRSPNFFQIPTIQNHV